MKWGNAGGEAYSLSSIGLAHHLLKQYQQALDFYGEALVLWQAVGDKYGEAYTLAYMGQTYFELGNVGKALDYLTQAMPLHRAVGDREGEAGTLYHLARLDRDRGDLVGACDRMEQALGIVEAVRASVAMQEFRATYLAMVRDYYDFYIQVLMELHRRDGSAGYDAKALQVSERARARSLQETLVEARVSLHDDVDPELFEQQRNLQQRLNARLALQLRMSVEKNKEEQGANLAKEVQSLFSELEGLEGRIRTTSPRFAALTQPRPLGVDEIQKQVLDDQTLLLEYALGKQQSYAWIVSKTDVYSYELPAREQIEKAARRVYDLLVVRNRRLTGETSWQRQKRVMQAESEYPKAAAALSNMIIAPVAGHLAGNRLLIVADGALQYVPFSALPIPLNAQPEETNNLMTLSTPLLPKPLNDNRSAPRPRPKVRTSLAYTPLLLKNEVVHIPSASTLGVKRQEFAGRSPAPKMVAVFADPVFEKQDPRVLIGVSKPRGQKLAASVSNPPGGASSLLRASSSNSPDHRVSPLPLDTEVQRSIVETGIADLGTHIPRLPFTREEAQAISVWVPRTEIKQALDFDASLATAMSPELSQFRILHFATHGLLNSVHPELSGLVLSLVDRQGRQQDGFLRLNEIYNLKLPAELVVLSACQTGLGKDVRGEGLIGLTRGFMYAGAARVMASLWKVDDRATAELMKKFYKGILGPQHLTPTAALRAAQETLWKDKQWQSPYYWAAFTIQGEWK